MGLTVAEVLIIAITLALMGATAVVIMLVSNRGGASAPSGPPAWHPDPSGRHHWRYWNGSSWTDHVSDASGATTTDPLPPS